MKKVGPSLGICTNAECIELKLGPVERYPGPGQYCPNCGDLLQLYDPQKPPRWCTSELPVIAAPPVHTPSTWFKRRSIVGVLILAIGASALLFTAHTSASERSSAATMFGVCGSSVTDRLARDIVGAFVAQNQAYANRIEVRDTDCAIRFSTALDAGHPGNAARTFRWRARAAAPGSMLGHDGVVAIVNPENPVSRLTVEQLRQVYAGKVRNWAVLHGTNGPMEIYLPAGATDEARIVSSAILHGRPVGSSVIRLPASADVVRAVVAANGRNRIGIVAFSTAVPAKVVALQPFPAPSLLSIGDKQYPLTIGVTVDALQSAQWVSGLLAYATTADAKALAVRDGFVP
jgi:hypothetical protein